MKQVKRGWLRRLDAVTSILDRLMEDGSLKSDDFHQVAGAMNEKVKSSSLQKSVMELFSPLYGTRYEVSILTMKFSPDGQYLASSGGDGIVHQWQLQAFSLTLWVDDNYFISGSIDRKVHIWAISGCEVIDWTDMTEIVTAVCHLPDGKFWQSSAFLACREGCGICNFKNFS